MTRRLIAETFVERFCAGNIDALEPLLANNLSVAGPLGTFESKDQWLAALRNDPPQKGTYRIL